ncbi:hypothetical protein, partial [Mycobacterium sp.]|uniref:hypothetical protein n=1 Tax=Mycobacterium sp. TaxID=1785 RepID=UPI003BAF556E
MNRRGITLSLAASAGGLLAAAFISTAVASADPEVGSHIDDLTIGGGSANSASGVGEIIGSGYFNTASGDSVAIGGGSTNIASGVG